ncbi:alpha/beta fold hydrolase [Kiloniella laminariae]|uniref:alpha/beta fold hydrolase n=1 Tax=Kiloniella laminariae TaxID=454162 RepID=UPI00037B27E4|nr:alpha/beta fold hydrolase [Kiloniella laminariae]
MPEDLEKEIKGVLSSTDLLAFPAALERAIFTRYQGFLQGVTLYQNSGYHRSLEPKPVVWSKGAARLLDYGTTENALPLLVIPSLVNRFYILDLKADNSFLRWLAEQGFRPFVMDWGEPGPAEKDFGLDDYIGNYLSDALDTVRKITEVSPAVLGYCMGGTLAVALARLHPDKVSAAVFMASPWDFHEGQAEGGVARLRAEALVGLLPLVKLQKQLPSEILQSLFASLDQTLSLRKFSAFNQMENHSRAAENFVALEDWLNDGVPLTEKVAEECLRDWYGENITGRGDWTIQRQKIRPDELGVPALSIVSLKDRIVPAASSMALAKDLPDSETIQTSLGHIGMTVSGAAQSKIWEPVAEWLCSKMKNK